MSKFKMELNSQGVRELLQSAEMEKVVTDIANKAHSSLGEGYGTDSYIGVNRVNAMVWADTIEAKIENSRSNTLLKAVRK